MFDNFHSKVAIEVNKKQNSVLKGFLPNWQTANFQLLYKASRDGFGPKVFHQKCDCKGQTLTFLLSEHAKVFGFYISSSLSDYENGRNDKQFFMFQLDKKTIHRPLENEYLNIENNNSSICIDSGYSNGKITLDFNLNGIKSNLEQFVRRIEIVHFEDNKEAESYLGGATNFKVLEMEVYQYM
ncbi:TLDc domain-containing protein [Oxytricha trifallax]|uniref:TLDc domain-containing protein n=1 Tax=Oxytricha trifallax TaxID=1172189 RepID=A0A073HWN0_9SPIT|nr:TLDc domain-containing protein [Oxytricha trifallax]